MPEAVHSVIDKISCDYAGLPRQVVYLQSFHMVLNIRKAYRETPQNGAT